MIYTDIKLFNKNGIKDVKINENATGGVVMTQLSRVLNINSLNVFIFNKRTGKIMNRKDTLRKQDVRGGDTLIFVERIDDYTC